MGGTITGDAPFFDRFFAGEQRDAGGWDRFSDRPAGRNPDGPQPNYIRLPDWPGDSPGVLRCGHVVAIRPVRNTSAGTCRAPGTNRVFLSRPWHFRFAHGRDRTRFYGWYETIEAENPGRDLPDERAAWPRCQCCAGQSRRISRRRLSSRLHAPSRFSRKGSRWIVSKTALRLHSSVRSPSPPHPIRHLGGAVVRAVCPELRHLGGALFRHEDRPVVWSRRTASHLSAQGIESWCLDNVVIDRA